MPVERSEQELTEIKRRTSQLKRFYRAWYRNFPQQAPKRPPQTDTDYDKWLAKLLGCSNYCAVNNARLGNLPMGRERIERLHRRLHKRLEEGQNGVRLWCLHWAKETQSPKPKQRRRAVRKVTLRQRTERVELHVGAGLGAKSIEVGEVSIARGGALKLSVQIHYKRRRRASSGNAPLIAAVA